MDGCRKRAIPRSLRFPGRHVYPATVVTLISALMLGTTPSRLARLSVVPGLDRRTLARWRVWWRSSFTDSPFAAVAIAVLVPPLDIAALPVSLLDRFAGDLRDQLIALLRFLGPPMHGLWGIENSLHRAPHAGSSVHRPRLPPGRLRPMDGKPDHRVGDP